MAKITLEDQPELHTFPADSILELKIEECNIKTVQGDRGDWEKLEFKFKILGIQAIGDGSPQHLYENWITNAIWGSTSARLTNAADNRLRNWAEAIFRQELGLGFELDTDLFVGRKVRGLTSTYKTRNGHDRHQIDALLPFGGMATAGAPAQVGVAPPQAPVSADPWAAQPPAAASQSWGSDEPPF